MKSFLEKYSQLSNRNQNIIISIGHKQNDYTFNNTIDAITIHKIILFINKTYKVRKKYYIETIYQKGNEQIKHIENEISYIIIKDSDVHMCDKYLLKWRKYNSDNIVIPSHDKYDHVYNKEILEFLIDNSFMCKIIITDNLYSLDIVVYKPCSINKITDFLNKLESI